MELHSYNLFDFGNFFGFESSLSKHCTSVLKILMKLQLSFVFALFYYDDYAIQRIIYGNIVIGGSTPYLIVLL